LKEGMSKFKLLLVFCLVFLVQFTFAQEQKARRITEILCSDSLYGRGYLKNGVNKAADFLAKEFEQAGLSPYLEDSNYLQPFQFDVNTFPRTVSLSVNGKELIPGKEFVVDAIAGGGKGKMQFVELDTTILDDKTALKKVISIVQEKEDYAFFLDLSKASAQMEAKLSYELKGIAQFGPLVLVTARKFTWSVGRAQLNYPIFIVKENLIDPSAQVNYTVDAQFVEGFESNNVIGYLPTKRKNAKTVVFTAHYDHLGGMGTTTSTFFPGANDNASGTAMLISMADYFRENRTKYNMLFIAFAGEEAGLLGSKYFVDEKSVDLDKIKFLLNLDIMGSGEDGITAVNGTQLKKPFKKLVKINDKKKYLTRIKPRGPTQNSDHYYFHKEGVPSFFIYTMGHNQHYHDIYDTYEELSFTAYDNIVKLLIDFVEKI
jgi:Zn-dependent M28 family amino/carboxypeptidase